MITKHKVWIQFAILLLALSGCNPSDSKPILLQVKEQKITVKGKEASIYTIMQPDGVCGLTLKKGDTFNVIVENQLDVPTSIHWHGLILPYDQDGVAFITQFPIYPTQRYAYQFPLVQSGTYWMHAHYGLQMQRLYTAPLILQNPQESLKVDQEIVLLLNDFTFTPPSKILSNLQCKSRNSPMLINAGADLTDVDYDAFLINFHTAEDPDRILVTPNTRIRLRIINGSSSTNFFLNLGELEGEAIAIDGNPVSSLKGTEFLLGAAQRIDLLITVPSQGGAFPFLAVGEGTSMQGGAILYTQDSPLPELNSSTATKAGPFSYSQEMQLHALSPLPSKEPDQKIDLVLGGNMIDYIWTINDQAWPEVTPILIEKEKRIEITFKNTSMMSHPMHLHGHVFQVTAINGSPFKGALRDTVLVLPNSTVTIQFDADNPGTWPLHCHFLYHAEAGMFTVVRYCP